MFFRNEGTSKEDVLQNQFTAYLIIAVGRRRNNLLAERVKLRKKEIPMEDNSRYNTSESDFQPKSVDQMEFKNELLERAVWCLNERERYIVFSHAITGRSYEELARELGLSYKGTAAVYYRAVKKIRHMMGDDHT